MPSSIELVLLLTSLTGLVYIYVGYPGLISVIAKIRNKGVTRRVWQPNVTVIVVAYNEEKKIGAKIISCLTGNYDPEKIKVIVASDGSDDRTNDIVAGFDDPRVRLVAHPERRGKAACLNDAVAACRDDIIVFSDARQRLDSNAISALVETLADPGVGAVSGELIFEPDQIQGFGASVDAYWRYEKFIRKSESRVHSMVGVTGALYALRRELYRPIPTGTILDDVLVPMNVVMAGYRVVLEPRAVVYDRPSSDSGQERRRKVRTLAGNFQLLMSHPRFLLPIRNPIAFQFVSHKVLRLMAPWLMALAFVSNAALATQSLPLAWLFVSQIAFYGTAVAGWVVSPLRQFRIVRLVMAFLLMNWFAVLGFLEFLRNRNAHMWRDSTLDPGRTG